MNPRLRNANLALAGVAQWTERWPLNQRVTIQFLGKAYAWVAGRVPSRGCERQPHIDVSFSFSFLSPLSKKN